MSASAPAALPSAMGRRPVDTRQSASSLVDEAVHRLRLAPVVTLGIYYAGSLPFVLALLYFCADMSRSADAAARGPEAALALAALFLGMKTAHAVFAARLRAQFARQPMPRWPPARLGRVLLVQTGLHAPGLFLLQVAAAVILPLGWVYAFYQNVTALGSGEAGVSARQVARRAWQHALTRPRMNHSGLSILFGLGTCAWLGLLVAAVLLPQLVQMFTGEENVFTSDVSSLFNTTLFLVSGALVYLALDPLVKTFYALRCFYEDSARTGEDLLSDLRALPPVAAAVAESGEPTAGVRGRADAAVLTRAGLVLALLWIVATPLAAAPIPVPTAPPASAPVAAPAEGPPTVSPPALDRSIREVLGRREFAWRAPRAPAPPAGRQEGAVARFVHSVTDSVSSHVRAAFRAAGDFIGHLRRWFQGKETPPVSASAKERGAWALPSLLTPLTYLLCGLLVAGIGCLLWNIRGGARRGKRLAGRSLDPLVGRALPPDLAAEDLLATQLPEDEWLLLAQRLLEAGERRLALRALYLSLLAGLGERKLLVIARHKSNRDYLQELRRRTRDRPEVPGVFGRSVGSFERVWYGSHPVDDHLLDSFQADREQVLAAGGR